MHARHLMLVPPTADDTLAILRSKTEQYEMRSQQILLGRATERILGLGFDFDRWWCGVVRGGAWCGVVMRWCGGVVVGGMGGVGYGGGGGILGLGLISTFSRIWPPSWPPAYPMYDSSHHT